MFRHQNSTARRASLQAVAFKICARTYQDCSESVIDTDEAFKVPMKEKDRKNS
jgi:hypothetical protein